MATYTTRNDRTMVRIRRDGVTKTKTFGTRAEAEAWAKRFELGLDITNERDFYNKVAPEAFDDDGRYVPVNMRELLEKYLREETPKKRSAALATP